jgi:hypothetical protein
VINYKRKFETGSTTRIRQQITTLRLTSITMELQRGLPKVALLRDGERRVPSCGSMVNVRVYLAGSLAPRDDRPLHGF